MIRNICRVCRTRQKAARIIRDKSGTELSVTAVGRLLKKGIPKRKYGSLPAKTDLKARQNFYIAVPDLLMQKVREGCTTFVMGCDFSGGIWSGVRRCVSQFRTASFIRQFLFGPAEISRCANVCLTSRLHKRNRSYNRNV